MSLQDYEYLAEIGRGSYGTVYKVEHKTTKEFFALKKVILTRMKDKEKQNALNEVRILAAVKNPNVVRYVEAFFDEEEESLCTIMEYLDDSDLEKKIEEYAKKGINMGEETVWRIFSNILTGLDALHSQKIIHRDLKSANIFLNSQLEAKVGDLNVAAVNALGLVYTQTGTPFYSSPEVWRGKPYNEKSDIWSLGCILYEMCAKCVPFRGNNHQQVFKKVVRGAYDYIPVVYSRDLHKIIASMLHVNPNLRPTTKKLIETVKTLKNSSIKTRPFSSGPKLKIVKALKFPLNSQTLTRMLPKSRGNTPKKKKNKLSLPTLHNVSSKESLNQPRFHSKQRKIRQLDESTNSSMRVLTEESISKLKFQIKKRDKFSRFSLKKT